MSKEIIDTRILFSEITELLFSLLHSLSPENWNAKTCYPNWTVKDIVTHLFQTGSSRLSRQRDLYPTDQRPAPLDFAELSKLIDQSNSSWTSLLGGISPKLLLDLLEITEHQLSDFIRKQNLDGDAFYSVAWAGEIQSANWFDLAREYTERWHHQEQIREALNAPSIAIPKYLSPVINILMHSVPYWYKDVHALAGTRLCIEVTGDSGGIWILERKKKNWEFIEDRNISCNEKIMLSDDTTWKFLMRAIPRNTVNDLIHFSSSSPLCTNFLEVKAIMMNDENIESPSNLHSS